MATVTESITGDRKQRKAGDTFTSTDKYSVKSFLDLQNKWQRVRGVNFSRVNANRIAYDVDISEYFTLGDIIRIDYSIFSYYFYVLAADSEGMDVYAGSDFTVPSYPPVTLNVFYLATSRNPDGFPWTFEFTAVKEVVNSMDLNVSSQDCSFSLKGNIATVNYHITSITLTGTAADTFGIQLPSFLPASTVYDGAPLYVHCTVANSGALEDGYILLTDTDYFTVYRLNGSNFTLGVNSAWLDVQFDYTVQI